ncbi:MAG: hypothetical protein GY788_23420 [bacterium]|nr:hypothetical protein [bacterium]
MSPAHLRRRLRQMGLTIESQRGHLKVRCPNGRLVVVPSTPSDTRSIKNTAAHLRRNGADLHWRDLT